MLDVSNQKHPSRMSFDSFITDLIKKTKSIKQSSYRYQIVENTKQYSDDLAIAYKRLSELIEKKKITSSGME